MVRLKKVVIMIILMIIVSIPAFGAEVSINDSLDEYIEVINPSLEESNEVEVRNNFFVSFNIKKEADLYLTIKKIVPVMDTIFLDKIVSNDMEKEDFTSNLTEHILELHNDDETVEDSEYVGKADEIKMIIDTYVNAFVSEQEAFKEYKRVQKETEVTEIENIIEDYESIEENYEEKKAELKASRKNYNDLFKVKILNRDSIESDGAMPYYEKTLEEIQYGSYEMIIELKTDDEFISLESFDLEIGPRSEVDQDTVIQKEIKLIQPMSLDELEE